ncbi:hypothetical protein [Clostridium amazonitimonense]|uniref:hypothetical protein n=1 Tax=Clostridium amazonitimonense TaxID=1499689 RepID=UPI000509B0A4|nr:hypothetical protein [Clostridium amazonitimonense]
MRRKLKTYILLILSLFLIGCNKKYSGEENVPIDYNYESFSSVTLMESSEGIVKAYNFAEGKKKYIEDVKGIEDFKYTKDTIVYLKGTSEGNELPDNSLIIRKKGKGLIEVNKHHSYLDIKLSKDGSKVAYRAFEEDSYDSVKGVMIYDVAENKEKRINTEVVISGNVYDWIDENNLVYYGSRGKESNLKGLFKYDFKNNKEDLIAPIEDGFIVYLQALDKENFMVMNFKRDHYELGIFNIENKEYNLVESKISKVFYSLKYEESIFIMAEDINGKSSIYKLESDKSVKRMIYDFPKNINDSGGMASDENGNVYFLGYDKNKEESKVYMIKKQDNSVNLIIDKEGNYHMYKREL